MDVTDLKKQCIACGLLLATIVEPTASCFAYHKQPEPSYITEAPVITSYKPELGIEVEEHPHNHPEDQSPFGYRETVVVASGTSRAITKTLTYTTNSMLSDKQTASFTTDSLLPKPA